MRTGSHNKKRNTISWISIISILICILITKTSHILNWLRTSKIQYFS